MPSLPLLKALGLNFSPNQLEVQPGSLVEASNVIIRRDNVIESRRGYGLYGTAMGSISDRCKQLITYKNKLIRHFSNRLQYEDGLNNSGITSFFDFNEIVSGIPQVASISEAQSGLRIKSIEANSNLYFTSSEGIRKISARSSDTFSASNITQAGGVKALDAEGFLNTTLGDQSSFLASDSGVAYKVVWGTKDANNNLVLGTPSDAVTVINPLLDLTLRDFSNLLLQLDNVTGYLPKSSLLDDTNYYSTLSLPLLATSAQLRDNLILLAKKLDEDLLFATDTGAGTSYLPLNISGATVSSGAVTVAFSAGTATNYFVSGDKINIPTDTTASILGFTSNGVGVDSINTNQLVTSVAAGNIVFTAKDYTTTNPVGVSGTITNISTVGTLGDGDVVLTCSSHGLKDTQIVEITGSNSVPKIDGTYTIKYLSKDTFSVNLKKSYSTISNAATAVTFQDAGDTVTLNSHGLLNGDSVVFTVITTTTGISINTRYYVVNAATNTFQVASSLGGAALPLTNNGTGTVVRALSENIVSTNHGYVANDTVSFSVTSATNEGVTFPAGTNITLSAATNLPHGLVVGDRVLFTASTISAVTVNTVYYVVAAGATTFQISATANGTPITLTAGTGTMNRVFTSTTYYVLSSGLATNSFKVSTTLGGSPNVISGSGNVSKAIPTAATGASWKVIIDGTSTAKIESYEFRSIEVPVEQDDPATNDQLLSIKDYLSTVLTTLQDFITARGSNIVSSAVYTAYLSGLDVTTNASVTLKITIPPIVAQYSVDNNPYFYQIYRTSISSVSGVSTINDIAIIQEYTQIEEKFPTSGELTLGLVTFVDDIAESIAGTGAALYTNERSGQGGLQANDIPPYALDINRFKGYVFFSNTRTRQRKSLSLIGVANMVSNYNSLNPYKLTISDGTTTNTYRFVVGVAEVTQLICGAAGGLVSSGTANYFTINSANNETSYYVWYKVGTAVDPAISGKTGISVSVNSADSANTVAQKTSDALKNNMVDFLASVVTATVTITNQEVGASTNATIGTLPGTFSISTITQGVGEDAANKQVLLSSNISVGIAIEDTAKSLIRVINKNTNEIVNGFYISGTSSTPGSFLLEGRGLSADEFYVMGSDSIIGTSFNPDLSPGSVAITAIAAGSPSLITTGSNHNLLNGDKIVISNSNSTPSIDGVYEIDYVSATQFYITPTSTITVAGTSAAFESVSVAEASSNEEQQHRVYYSKYQEPEAVPLLNYFDIGATDKAILRIFPLRDSLFVFKQDGLYRISGETTPFTVALFDSSCILIAPDSIAVSNNQVYGWTTQGISVITEAGVSIISRPIDTEILKKASSQFTNFSTATWGVGYESDNSYTVYTTNEIDDTLGTIGFRYSNLTSSWTTVDKSATCGLVSPSDDKLYLGAGDVNYIEKERKEFTRYDYADRELAFDIASGSLSGTTIALPIVSTLTVGDVVVQTQTLTVFEFNSLLQKLDLDPGVPSSDYYSTLGAQAGDDLRAKIEALATKLDTELTPGYAALIASLGGSILTADIANPAEITTASAHGLQTGRYVSISGNTAGDVNGNFQVTVTGLSSFTVPVDLLFAGSGGGFSTLDDDFQDIKICYNLIISRLNSDAVVSFSNYRPVDNDTVQEAIIDSINEAAKTITLNLSLDYVVGPISIFKAIPCRYTYAPLTMGDALGLKHIREATMMFSNKAFTSAELNFSTDLLPELVTVSFDGDGNGIFGHQNFGSGFFGGGSNSAPFRTYIPRQCQRCRYINVGFAHGTAREQFAIYGITLTGEIGQSTRAYR